MSQRNPLKVPATIQPVYDQITSITDDFCAAHLDVEYAGLARKMTAALARKRPSPLVNGKMLPWAAGILYTLGQVNFLFDQGQSPHLRADDLCALLDVSKSTASNRARQIRDLLNVYPMHPNWCLPALIDDNPYIWILEVNGLMVDIRSTPREIQEIAYRKGLIPYIPADRESS